MPLSSRIDWLVGVFYTDERTDLNGGFFAADPLTGERVAEFSNQRSQVNYEEYALFSDVTFHLTDRIDVQVGGRQSRNEQTFSSVESGPFVELILEQPSPSITPEVTSKDDSFTYLITPRLRISEDLMVYARLASGYRPGGPNADVAQSELPQSFDPDTTQNYEIGIKGAALDNALSFDASVYLIDWKDLQILVTDLRTAGGYTTNAGRARSRGVELSLEARPTNGLSIGAWVAWNDAELTKDFPSTSALIASAGDSLPYAGRISGYLALEQSFDLSSKLSGFVGASISFVDERKGEFAGDLALERQVFPSYSTIDLRAGCAGTHGRRTYSSTTSPTSGEY